MTALERVGFIGLGGMGRRLVKNLVVKRRRHRLRPEPGGGRRCQIAGRDSR